MRVVVNPTPLPPPKEGRDPVHRVTVQFLGSTGESLSIMVVPRAWWRATLRPLLLAGAAATDLTLDLQESS
jgi:hypothetical protein